MREHLVAYFADHQRLIEPAALDLLLSDPQPLLLSRRVLEQHATDGPFVTCAMVESARARAPVALSTASRKGPAREAASTGLDVLREGFSPPPMERDPLTGYRALFTARLQALGAVLRGRPELPNLRPIEEASRAGSTVSVIGLVRQVRSTQERHHLILTVEDETGAIELLAPHDSTAGRETILVDEVVGVRLRPARERGRLGRVEHLERPEVPPVRPGTHAGSACALFLSDLHLGSRSFLEESWGHLVDFLHGRGPEPGLAASIRYVVIAGDLVDGIGVYPNQERDLAVTDVFEQYALLGRHLSTLPAHLQIVCVPGNHDAVCPAEPQPALPPEIRGKLPTNVRALSNPSTFALDGTIVSAYHGRSFDDLIPAIPGASYARPTDVMRRMLSMRHLAPIYGGRTPLAPLPSDGLVLDPPPEILVTGHAHTYGVDRYRGVLLLNASSLQAVTDYQRMRNITPVPARGAIVRRADRALATVDCSGGAPVVLRSAG